MLDREGRWFSVAVSTGNNRFADEVRGALPPHNQLKAFAGAVGALGGMLAEPLSTAGTNEVSPNITGVTQAAGETGKAAGQVQTASGELPQHSETLKSGVGKFLAQIRSGGLENSTAIVSGFSEIAPGRR